MSPVDFYAVFITPPDRISLATEKTSLGFSSQFRLSAFRLHVQNAYDHPLVILSNTSGLPAVALFALHQRRFPAMIGAVVTFVLMGTSVRILICSIKIRSPIFHFIHVCSWPHPSRSTYLVPERPYFHCIPDISAICSL